MTAFTDDDAGPLAAWLSDLDLQRLVNPGIVEPLTAAQLLKDDSWLSADRKNPNSYLFAIRTTADDHLIGITALSGVQPFAHYAEFGINIGHADYRGQGYGTEVSEVMLHYAFMELNLNRVWLSVFSYNARALKLYDKLGFTREVVKREALYRDGAYHDEIIMGLLRAEWEARHAG
jgi:RimJ/RimL family protein N-acetyltransferase